MILTKPREAMECRGAFKLPCIHDAIQSEGVPMVRPSFASLQQPFICGVIRDTDPGNAIATIKNSQYDGAQAFLLQMSGMDKKYRNERDLSRIMNSTTLPILVLNYRENGFEPDEERVRELLVAIEAGAAAVDIPADTFDPEPADWMGGTKVDPLHSKPQELSTRPEVVDKQRKLFEQVHAMGAEVLISSHTRTVMNTEQVVAHAQEMASRGADMVKIVTIALNEDHLVEAFRTTVELKRTLQVPFLFHCHGVHGKLSRVVNPMLGSMLVFCNQRYTANTLHEQPLIHAMRSVFQNVDWSVPIPAGGETFNKA